MIFNIKLNYLSLLNFAINSLLAFETLNIYAQKFMSHVKFIKIGLDDKISYKDIIFIAHIALGSNCFCSIPCTVRVSMAPQHPTLF